jgi:uncharacterized protein YjbI with pentapeptide repeats
MNKQWAGTGAPLVRADIELRLSQLEHSAQLDLHAQNLRQIDLSYIDLQGANLRDADLQGANLRGTNLSSANLQGTDLSGADLDGADLSRAQLGGIEEERAKLRDTKLSYALLRELDLRGFDLAELNLYHADLSGTDLRGAIMRGADLRGADLSTALLHGPELQGAILYRGAFLRDRSQQTGWEEASHLQAAAQPVLIQDPMVLSQEQEGPEDKQHLSDREAYLFGTTVPLTGADPAKIQQLFSQGFSFARARQLFEAWLGQAGIDYSEQEAQALWIGFARRICDLYFEAQ